MTIQEKIQSKEFKLEETRASQNFLQEMKPVEFSISV